MQLAGSIPIPDVVRQRYVAEGLWNDSGLRDGVEAFAKQTPAQRAVVDMTSTWSYEQLAAAVATVLGALQNRGIGRESSVLVIAPLTAPAVATYQAVIRTGAVVVMLDRRCGRADVANALKSVDITLVVSTAELLADLGVDDAGVATATFAELLAWPAPATKWAEPDPDAPMAAVFTSGTTSRPKCVVHSLNTLRSGARNLADVFEVASTDVAFLSTPLASITGLVQTHLMLDRGATLMLEDRFAPAASLARLRQEGATILGGAPVIIEELFKQADAEGVTELPLRSMALGGAMVPRATLELAVERYGIRPVRMYGSSEVPSSTGTQPSDEGDARLANDGACSRGTELREVGPPPGEIHVRGPMRFLGYLDEQDNRECFAEDGWYRSGDLGRVDDGRLTVLGRLKETVSRKGLKISLNEIDDFLRALPGAEEVAAFAVPDPDTGERLAIAVHTRDDAAVDFDGVVGWLLGEGLAKWKLPEQVVLWDEALPRTESGKIQRRKLLDGVEGRTSMVAPRLRAPSAGQQPPRTMAADERLAVEDLLSAYVLALDAGDIDAAVALFTDDGEFETYGRVFTGERLRSMFEAAPRGLHLTGRSLVTPTPEGATVRSQLLFLPADRSSHRMTSYDDVVAEVDGRWLFRSRSVLFMASDGSLQQRPEK